MYGLRTFVAVTWLRTFATTAALVVAVGLCVMLVGLTRAPGVDVGDTFRVIPRVNHMSSVTSGLDVKSEVHLAGDPAQVSDGPPDDSFAMPLSATPTPDLISLPVDLPLAIANPTRSTDPAGCRGPPA